MDQNNKWELYMKKNKVKNSNEQIAVLLLIKRF